MGIWHMLISGPGAARRAPAVLINSSQSVDVLETDVSTHHAAVLLQKKPFVAFASLHATWDQISGRHFSHRVASSETTPKLSFSKTKVQTKPHNKVQFFWSIFRTKCKPQTKVQAKIRPTSKRAPWRPFWELPSISQPLSLHQPRVPGSSPRFEGRSRFRFAFGPGGSHCHQLWPPPDTQQWPFAQERESFCHKGSQILKFALGFRQPQLAGKPSVNSLSANLNLYSSLRMDSAPLVITLN